MLTFRIVQVALGRVGVTIRCAFGDEYRVNIKCGGTEDTAYYTGDLEDALATGIAMASQRTARANAQFLQSPFAKDIGND